MEEKNIPNANENELLDRKSQQELEAKSQEIVKKLDKENSFISSACWYPVIIFTQRPSALLLPWYTVPSTWR